MFSRRVTGLYGILSASESIRPETPLPIVPSQYASTWSGSTPAERYASPAASTSRSSGPLSQCSPNGVQPMPTIATRSLIPLLAMASPSTPRTGLPKVVVDALRGEEAPERHLEVVPDRDLLRVDVGQLAREPPPALVVDERRDDGRLERVREVVERVRRHAARRVGEALVAHLVDRAALDAHALRREVARPALRAARADEGELPAFVPAHRRRGGTLRIGPPRRLERQDAAPLEV